MITKVTLAAFLATVAVGAVAAPQIASAASCTVTRTHAVKRVVHRSIHRPVAVAAYREGAPAVRTRTIVETRYIREPTRVVVAPAPAYYGDYAPYPVYYHHYGYYHGPYYHHVYYDGPYDHHHW
jgi:hypothetical protein